MTCEICGRGACCKSFHSLEEQTAFDEVADNVKERLINTILSDVSGVESCWGEDLDPEEVYVKLDDVEKVIKESW